MLVAPQALKSVIPVEDLFSNKEMRTFRRIRAHQSTSETFKTSLKAGKNNQAKQQTYLTVRPKRKCKLSSPRTSELYCLIL